MLQECNACHVATGDSGSILSLAEVMDSSKLSQILDPCYSYLDRQELIEAYLLLTRSSEELKLLVCDMENVISYYKNRVKILADAVENECGRERSGAHALLRGLLQQTEQQLKQYRGLLIPPSLIKLLFQTVKYHQMKTQTLRVKVKYNNIHY